MPGMMISSESAKKRLRRPMMLSRRTFGSAATSGFDAPSVTTSAPCCWVEVRSDSSDTVDSKQGRPAEAAAGEDDGQQVVRHDDRRDQARHHSDAERQRKAFDG